MIVQLDTVGFCDEDVVAVGFSAVVSFAPDTGCVRRSDKTGGFNGGGDEYEEEDEKDDDREDVDRASDVERDEAVEDLLCMVWDDSALKVVLNICDRWREDMSAVGTRAIDGPGSMRGTSGVCSCAGRRSTVRVCSYTASAPPWIASASNIVGTGSIAEFVIESSSPDSCIAGVWGS